MADLSVLSDILSARNTLVAIFGLAAVALWRAWTGLPAVMARWNERERDKVSERASDFERLREELKRSDERNAKRDDRITFLEESEQRCRHDLADALRRLAVLEGYEMGRGKAAQDAQAIVSTERMKQQIEKERGER
jgi:hypothetical protein